LSELPAGSVVQIDYSSLDCIFLSEIYFNFCQLLLPVCFELLQFPFKTDAIQKIGDLGIFALHLVLSVSTLFYNLFCFRLGEDTLVLVEEEFVSHLL
jgi:hypothetical protein